LLKYMAGMTISSTQADSTRIITILSLNNLSMLIHECIVLMSAQSYMFFVDVYMLNNNKLWGKKIIRKKKEDFFFLIKFFFSTARALGP